MDNNEFLLEDVDFGAILNRLIASDTVTDIMMWENEIWLTDIQKGHYRYDARAHTRKEKEELEHLLYKLPRQIAIRMQVSYNEGSPILDGEAVYANKGQLRINAIHESLCSGNYPALAIRKTLYQLRINEESILSSGFAEEKFLWLMAALVDAGANVIIGGETGSGKTELLKYLARYIREEEAVITMEDTLEVYLKRLYPQKNVLALKTTLRYGFQELLRSCLRQNPDWICVSETRGVEVMELCEAVGTGHHLMSTIHTDGAMNIPYRMVDMSRVQGAEAQRLFRQIHHNINIGIYIYYYNDSYGSHRQIAEVCEFYLDDDGAPQSHMIYRYDYEKKNYRCAQIQSSKIRMKLLRKQTDCVKLEGVFL